VSPESLVDRVVLVTGGGRGIGAAIARELAAAGARVAVSGRTATQVDAVAAEAGGLALVGDVADTDVARDWVATIEREIGPVDLLVNNAAVVGAIEPFWEHAPADWWRIFEINLLGPFLCCHAVIPSMIARGRGRIINITSGAAYINELPANARDTSYPASKAALTRFSERLAAQLAPYGIRVFAVAPGIVRTKMTASLAEADTPWTPAEAPSRLVRLIAEGRGDALSGRYLHAEHDADLDALNSRAAEIEKNDLNVIRLRR
jgi:NAD(P)-dependent dehydrogenase (short-subunit alcohol dehydrogenase family)